MFWEYDPFLVEVLLEKDLVVTIFLSDSLEADEPEETGLTRGDGVDRGAGSLCFGVALQIIFILIEDLVLVSYRTTLLQELTYYIKIVLHL